MPTLKCIGLPREIKSDEYRTALLPVGVQMLCKNGHEVLVERQAGVGCGYEDEAYEAAGATMVDTANDVWGAADMIVKVKEPLAEEYPRMRAGQTVFTYFHFAASKELTQACIDSGITAVAYETLTDAQGRLPLLTPMSEVAGRMAIQEGAKFLEKPMLGRGILLGGVPGVEPANVVVLGAGVVGINAAKMAAGLGAHVVIMDINLDRLRYVSDVLPSNVMTVYSDPYAIEEHCVQADLVVGAVLIPGGRTPVLLTKAMLPRMRNGAVVVDVGVDQGGCFETTRPTTHQDPTYVIDGIVHYCVANMPGAVGRTSTQALCHATQPYVMRLAKSGIDELAAADQGFTNALNIKDGKIVNQAVAQAFA